VPGILVGRRQELRDTGPNVLRVPALRSEVSHACRKCLNDMDFLVTVKKGVSPYGDGTAAVKIANHLKEISFTAKDLLKTMTY
jgi:UDP-N-acetylglucosamine 2-epimerase